VIAAIAVTLAPGSARADVAGVNMGAPVWGGVVAEGAMNAAVDTGAHWVRVNFRLDAWAAPGDPTQHGGRTWFDAYDRIVDGISSQGLEVYGLLNDELTNGVSRTDLAGAAFEEAYAKNAIAVIDRYKDRVRVWETINEPNDWAGGTSARIPAAAFARLHARVYDDAKRAHAGDPCWDVTLVTGPLFSFDDVSSADYLDATITAGRSGGRWKAIREATGHDPVDGVGYHLYVAQGMGSPRTDVGAKGGANLDAVRAVLEKRGIGARPVWVSEIGWRIPDVDEATQADRVDAMFETLGKRDDVASLQWFTIVDFPGNAWGLFRGGFSEKDKRPAGSRVAVHAKTHAPELAARLEVTLPRTLTVGSRVVARVKATNLGRMTWTEAAAVRLGAAAGCPAAWARNGWTWLDPGAEGGYVKGPTDARRYLPKTVVVPQGEAVEIVVPLTAPAAPGKAVFAARMVREGVAWFGSTVSATTEVTAAPPEDAGADGGAPDGGTPDSAITAAPDTGPHDGGDAGPTPVADTHGCGCRAGPTQDSPSGGTPCFALVLALVAARARARTGDRDCERSRDGHPTSVDRSLRLSVRVLHRRPPPKGGLTAPSAPRA
jgi:hypothetical protein